MALSLSDIAWSLAIAALGLPVLSLVDAIIRGVVLS